MQNSIYIKGARENNLKNIDVEIPRDKLVVITGLSGSGKSSLAFDTIYAEGQRRYVESLSSYARMFLGQMDKPDVDYIDGLSPAISIDQKTTSKNPRSTVGTVTEIYDYLRLLWARVGVPHCPKCGKEIRQQSIDQIVDQIMALPEGTRIQLMAPVVRSRKGEHAKVFEDAKKSGYVRVRVDGIMYDLTEEIKLEKNKKHIIEIVVDRLVIKPDITRRLTDSAETAMALAGGLLTVDIPKEDRRLSFSQNYACEDCGISVDELAPRRRQVPILGNVAAGNPILAQECIEDYLTFDTGGHDDEYFALRVRGESMLGVGILPDDLVVVHRQNLAQNGQIVVALLGDEATVKTLKRKGSEVWLMPANPDYQPIDGRECTILGRVVAVVRQY